MLVEQVKNIFDNYGKLIVADLKRKLQEDDTNVTGSAVSSLSYLMSESGLEILGNRYISAIDAGTVGYNKPPSPRNLEDWINARGITSNNPKYTTRDLAFAMSRTISLKGTIKRFQYKGSNLIQFVIDKNLQPLSEDLGKVLSTEIKIIAEKAEADANKS